MIIDYKINATTRPSERAVWLMAKRAEEDGNKISMAIMRGLESGELKYVDGKFYKLCRTCVDYLPLDHFYPNKRYVMGVGYTCKKCISTKRRIRKYGVPALISDIGMKDTSDDLSLNFTDETVKILKRKLIEYECNSKKDS